jgi:hypothetical protein
VAKRTQDSRRAITDLASGHLGRKLTPSFQVFLKGFYKFIAVYCHAETQNCVAGHQIQSAKHDLE